MKHSIVAGCLGLFWSRPASACTDFLLNNTAINGHRNILSGRTMDFSMDLQTVFEIIPQNTQFQELPVEHCPKCPNYAWKSKYGFVATNAVGLNIATDGMNEKGLSAAFLFLYATEMPKPNMTDTTRPMITNLVSYILGNYGSTEEVEEGFRNKIQPLQMDGPLLEGLLNLEPLEMTLHLSVHDASGKSLAIEFIDEEVKIHDNTNGVLTNDPPFDQQLENLAQSPPTLPGDYTPKSRFVRTSKLNQVVSIPYFDGTSYSTATQDQSDVSAAVHILNSVVLPRGVYGGDSEADENDPILQSGSTQWSLVRDHTNKRLFYQSTQNQVLRMIDFKPIDFTLATSRKAIPVTLGDWYVDETSSLVADWNNDKSKDLPPRQTIVNYGGLLANLPFIEGILVGVGLSGCAFFLLTLIQRRREKKYKYESLP